jgi:hypothetical protein
MNCESYIVYGWEENLLSSIIDLSWLRENNIDIFTLELNRNKPNRIIYGAICSFSSKSGRINNNNKNIVIDAFDLLLNNNIKLQYYIALKTKFNYYSFYNSYNPNHIILSDTEDNISTDVPLT